MPSSSEHQHPGVDGHPLGSHMLGPHVVGRRVVVRRVVPGETGPTGGPAFTDVLGTCLTWDDDTCRIEREDGSVVVVALRDVVSGKPIPPRPTVRHRVGVRDAELHTASLWPSIELEPRGDWVLRSSDDSPGRPLKRANSCLALGDPGLPLDGALAAVHGFYTTRGKPVLVATEVGGEVEAALLGRGWEVVPGGQADFMLGSVSRALRACRRSPGARAGSRPEVLTTYQDDTHVVARLGDGQAHGSAALDGDWLGLHGLWVDPDQRRRGHATAVLAELLDWGAELGATSTWLHVETDNVAARALYEGLGLSVHHEMTYLRPGQPSDGGGLQITVSDGV